jgi:hypothetical protein
MAKVGILTQPIGNSYGYGGILQAFALQHVLRDMGMNPIILNRVRPWYYMVAYWGWGGINYFLGRRSKFRIFPVAKELEVIAQHTSNFISNYISITEPIKSTRELIIETNKKKLETVIVGSDQVWRKAYSPCMPNYFLNFISDNDRIKKIAYAASFGIDEWEYGKKETKNYRNLVQKFDAISVREDSAVELCSEYLGVNATHVLDPTMLVDKSVYESLAMSPITHSSVGNLFYYILDQTPIKMSLVNRVAKEKSLYPFNLLPKKNFAEITSYRELDDCIFPPVEQWLRSFMEAEFVITDSFHGTLFSLIFNKPLIVILNNARGATRFTSILNKYIGKNAYNVFCDNISDLDNIDIDQLVISNTNEGGNFRRNSIKFLKDALL